MDLEASVVDLVGRIYEAAGDATLWTPFLVRLGNLLDAPTINFAVQEFPRASGRYNFDLGSVGLDPGHYRSYTEYYGARNPVLIRGGPLMKEGRVYRDLELCPHEELVQTEFYNDWLQPQGMSHALFGIVLKGKGYAAFTNAVRYRNGRPFSEDEVELLRRLSPHFKQAVKIHLRIKDLEVRAQATQAALDRWSLGVILVNARGEVIHANQAAEHIISQRDGLTLNHKTLNAAVAAETFALRALIHSATKATNCQALAKITEAGGTTLLTRPSRERPLQVVVTPACTHASLVSVTRAVAMVFVSDHETQPQPHPAFIERLYALTRSEAAVASYLVQGKSVEATAEELGITRNAVRFHLKHIYDKTDTHRQGELVRLILSSPAQLLQPTNTARATQMGSDGRHGLG